MQSQQQLQPAPIGIDLGSFKSKIAVAKRGGVQVITNEANFRETPCIVGFGSQQRQIGEPGSIKMKSNFRDSIVAPMRFVNLATDNPMFRAQTKFCAARSNISSGKLQFEVNYQGQKESLYPEQALGAYFNKLKTIIAINGFENKQAVVAVPPYLTQSERKGFLVAAKIAELNVTRLINESTAVALDYGMFRKTELQQTARNVLFLDFGQSKLSIFCCSFTKQEMNVLYQDYQRHIGCRDLDYLMYEFYRAHFEKASGGLDLEENRKSKVKLMEYLERQRKILTGNKQFEMNVECIMEDNDLQFTMTRDKFHEISAPVFSKIHELLLTAREALKEKGITLHSVELIGGGSRIPNFIAIVKQIFRCEPSRTLNSSESVARGCALMAAIRSPLFRVQDYSLIEKAQYGVKMYWNFVDGNKYLGPKSQLYPEKQGKMIFEKGCKVPTSKTIKFSRKEAIEILIEYEPSIVGFGKTIAYYVTKPQHPKEETFGVQFKAKYTDDGLVTIDDFNLVEEWTEEVKIPKKKAVPPAAPATAPKAEENTKPAEDAPKPVEEEQFEIKKSKKERFTKIDNTANTFDFFSEKEVHDFFSIESAMLNQDKMIIDTYEKKNQLEALAYKWKDRLTGGEYIDYATPGTVPDILEYINSVNEWLYGDGEKSNRGTYVTKTEELNSKVVSIEDRYVAHGKYKEEYEALVSSLKYSLEFLNSTDEKYKHVDSKMREPGFQKLEETNKWLQGVVEASKDNKKFEKPKHSASQLKEKNSQLVSSIKSIMLQPVPPKKEEPKAEAEPKADDESQTKMDEEVPKAETNMDEQKK